MWFRLSHLGLGLLYVVRDERKGKNVAGGWAGPEWHRPRRGHVMDDDVQEEEHTGVVVCLGERGELPMFRRVIVPSVCIASRSLVAIVIS